MLKLNKGVIKFNKNVASDVVCSDKVIQQTFCDDRNDIMWVKVDDTNKHLHMSSFDLMKNWSSNENMRKYISKSMSIDELFMKFIKKDDALGEVNSKINLFFCYDKDDNFIGLSYITAPLKQNDSSVIEYLIVNPEFQHKGYATRMVSSIINSENSEFFNGCDLTTGYKTYVDETNLPSLRVFKKCGFDVVDRFASSYGKSYHMLERGLRLEDENSAS